MLIKTDVENFVPTKLTILNFYGNDTCFAWNEDKFICFPYEYKNATEKLKVIQTPAKIKRIREVKGRIFILCFPCGIYKLADNLVLGVLSTSGIELGLNQYQVFSQSNGNVVLEDKKQKSYRKLFVSTPSTNELDVLPLIDNVNKIFSKALLHGIVNSNIDLCLVTHERNLFKISSQTVQIIYNCDFILRNILPVVKNGQITSTVLLTNSNLIVFMHCSDDKLKYEKINLCDNIHVLCPLMDVKSENTLLLIYSDGEKTYYTRKTLTSDSIPETYLDEHNYLYIQFYLSKFIIYLSNSNELLQVPVAQLRDSSNYEATNYVKLYPNMLKGLEDIVEVICDKTKELKDWKKEMSEKEEELQRIHLFVNKNRIKYCPKDIVQRMLNSVFLVTNFEKELVENSVVVRMLKNRGKTIFAMKKSKDYETVVEMPICIANLSSKLYITTDLITYKNEGIWCLIKNYIKDPLPSKSNKVHLTAEKLKFVKYKLIVLQNLMKGNNVTMEALTAIKRDIRQNINLKNV